MGSRRVFVATCVPHDDEMRRRVARHQAERSDAWQTLEIPVDLAGAIAENSPLADVMLVDCLTLWLSNLLMETDDVDRIRKVIDGLAEAVQKAPHAIVLVSNEVGAGIVPKTGWPAFTVIWPAGPIKPWLPCATAWSGPWPAFP